LQEAALIEVLAQGAAAGSMLRERRNGRRVMQGFLAGVREFEVMGEVRAGDVVEVWGRHENTFGALSQMVLEARVAARVVARGRMTFHLEMEKIGA
jgi:hypothetical protein